ncbi:Bromodomain-containing protein 2 [Trichoplax sp. H2]|nr:Bromodomain-containing protein 2 [Trichoplax sp. H2]|eukprot:RDD43887.1 Bromodomain-containing protein 2 [Trichoplax sp. H2]
MEETNLSQSSVTDNAISQQSTRAEIKKQMNATNISTVCLHQSSVNGLKDDSSSNLGKRIRRSSSKYEDFEKPLETKVQGKGRDTNQLRFLKTVIDGLWKHRYAWPFRQPVDPVKLQLPDYFKIIKKPMDLGTIKRKLEGKMYHSAKECMDDILRTFTNCYTYNKTSDDIVLMCEELEKVYKKKLAQMPAQEFEITSKIKTPPSLQGKEKSKKERAVTAPVPASGSPVTSSSAPVPTVSVAPQPQASATKSLAKVKKGVKRKADTTTPTPIHTIPAKSESNRNQSKRRIKKPVKDLPTEVKVLKLNVLIY